MKTRLLLASLLLATPLATLGQAPAAAKPAMPPNHPPIGGSPHAKEAPSPWAVLADYSLTVKVPPKGDTGTWRVRTFEDPADVVVDLDTPGPKGRTKGTIMLVGGQAIATRGYVPEKGYEVDALDAAIVNLKVATRLLDAAVPGGPAAVKDKQAVSARDDRTPIVASTPSANAQFNAPWSLQGTVERTAAGAIAFRLELDTPGAKPGERSRWVFSGTASGSAKGRALDAAMSLSGWTAYTLGPPKGAKPSHATLRFGATPLPGPFATLKDLRAALK